MENLDIDNNEFVNWLSRNKNNTIDIHISPLDVSSYFKEFVSNKTVILTSATLKVNNDFKYIKSRLGLEELDVYSLDSNFDYKRQMLIKISKNNLNPNNEEFMEYVIEFLNKYLEEKQTNSFILCTSYSQVEQISNSLNVKSYNILVQGTLSRAKLIEEFKNVDKSVLVATDSFWEGIDVKGDKLKNVIIVKLPFQAPDDPINEAIIENLGNRAFVDYQLPKAIIKLKQGVGRLIRSTKDTGEIVILDGRVYNKKYGSSIIKSLPTTTIENF